MSDLDLFLNDYFKGLDSRFNPKFKSILVSENIIKLCIEETFRNSCIENTFVYTLTNDFKIMPMNEEYENDSDVSTETTISFNSFDEISDYAENEKIKEQLIYSKKDIHARRWIYMVPLEEWYDLLHRKSARPIQDF